MEWITVAAASVDEARESALDALGVTADELEFEVVDEPRPGLFGRLRGQYKIRARVAPTQPREKVDRRNRRGRKRKGGSGSDGPPAARTGGGGRGRGRGGRRARSDAGTDGGTERPAETPPAKKPQTEQTRGSATRSAAAPPPPDPQPEPQGAPMSDDISLDEQEPIALDFLEGLLDALDVDGDVSVSEGDDEALEFHVDGARDELGLLIGSRGSTITAVQELLRTAVAQQLNGRLEGRLRLDVGGYRERRKEALASFTRKVAEDVLASGKAKALEPMPPPDRKVVHDTCNEIDGVHTESQGENHRRRVVIIPD